MDVLHTSYIEDLIGTYGVTLDENQCEAIRRYVTLLLRWNQRISLTRVTDPESILRFHFGESLFAIPKVPIRGGRLADVGSGAGFPGVPLRIALPDLKLSLIESNVRKAAFLAEVCRELNFNDVEVFRGRMESVPEDNNPYDFITARALGNHPDLLKWASRHLAPGGSIVLWLGDAEASTLAESDAWEWRKPVHVPGSERRFLLVGAPKS